MPHRVGLPPAPWEPTNLEYLDLRRQVGVDREAVSSRFEAQHRAQKEHGGPCRPRLRAARSRVLDWKLGALTSVTRERFWQTVTEVTGRLHNARSDARRLVTIAVTIET